jgi:hypothetical protein
MFEFVYVTLPFTRRMCFGFSFAAFLAIASTAERTTSLSYASAIMVKTGM